MLIKAIDTEYNGFLFRSRVEARWAIFFDALGIKYEYEPQGFELDESGTRYLPDFWLPALKCWVEIKGQEATRLERAKICMLAEATGANVLLITGNPSRPVYLDKNFPEYGLKPAYEMEMYVGNLWEASKMVEKEVWISYCIGQFEDAVTFKLTPAYEEHPEWFSEPIPKFEYSLPVLKKIVRSLQDYAYALSQPAFKRPLDRRDTIDFFVLDGLTWGGMSGTRRIAKGENLGFLIEISAPSYLCYSDLRLDQAYDLAKKARFEFGQTPAISRMASIPN